MNSYSITDSVEFARIMRNCAAESLAEEYTGEAKSYTDADLDTIVTLSQIESLISEHSIGRDEENQEIIDTEIFNNIFDETRNLIYQSAMSQLAAKGLVECAWDDEKNKMVFWVDTKQE
tara:strand:+ start:234 stop:590 length:357 start_codon:yes stop_codon:yes gene_type:complete